MRVRRDALVRGLWWAVALLASLGAVHVTETAQWHAKQHQTEQRRTPPPVRMPMVFESDAGLRPLAPLSAPSAERAP